MRLSAKVLTFPSSSEKPTQESKAPTLKSRIVNLASSDRLDVGVTIFIFSRACKFSLSPRAEIKQNSHMLPVLLYAVSRASRALATFRGLQAVAGMWPERLAEHTAGSLGGCSFSPSNFHVLSNILIFQIFLSSLDSLM